MPGGRPADLWFEITPQSFNVRIKEGIPLTQLMVFRRDDTVKPVSAVDSKLVFDGFGNPIVPRMHDRRLILSLRVPDVPPSAVSEQVAAASPRREADGSFHTPPRSTSRVTAATDVGVDDVAVAVAAGAHAAAEAPASGGHKVSREECDLVGYEAIATNEVLDLSKIGEHPAENFFRPVQTSVRGGRLTLEKDRFYILATKEFIAVPLDLSAEMVPFSHLVRG